MLVDEDTAQRMVEDGREGRQRAREPEKPALYLYIGGGARGQPDCIKTFVIRTKDRASPPRSRRLSACWGTSSRGTLWR